MRRRIATIGALLAGGLLALAAPAGADWTAYQEGGALKAADHTSGRATPLKAAGRASVTSTSDSLLYGLDPRTLSACTISTTASPRR